MNESKDRLQKKLEEQIELLEKLCDAYDQDDGYLFAYSMATSLRLILHDYGKKKSSLLRKIGIKKSTQYYNPALITDLASQPSVKGSACSLISYSIGKSSNKKQVYPILDGMKGEAIYSAFDDYWGHTILIDGEGNTLSRGEVIINVTNKDGGAHVQDDLPVKFKKLVKENSMKVFSGKNEEMSPIDNIELAIIRQISHEVIKSFSLNYLTPELKGGVLIGGVSEWLITKEPEIDKPRRKGLCPCGSGKKYKRCCEVEG